ncbi:MAG: helix-turn-helix domain-containing protein [Actinomycetia bacterium]|nr:helix-turn-helix domain-containing protein [Actinomycetes bacterium]
MATKTATFGEELRRWRTARGVSQLDLAGAAEVSQRHVSFLETGRSKPSPEMVVHLGRTLDLGLRDQNLLLGAAGYAPVYAERGLDDPDLDQVRDVLTTLVAAHGHFPAYVVDRQWDLVLANPMAQLIVGAVDPAPPASVAANILRLTLHPEGLRPMIVNWEQLATTLIHRLEREVTHSPNDSGLQALYDEARVYPGVDALPTRSLLPDGNDLLVPVHANLGGVELRFFTTITTIGAPFDITLEGLRLETLLPADAETDTFLRQTSDSLN